MRRMRDLVSSFISGLGKALFSDPGRKPWLAAVVLSAMVGAGTYVAYRSWIEQGKWSIGASSVQHAPGSGAGETAMRPSQYLAKVQTPPTAKTAPQRAAVERPAAPLGSQAPREQASVAKTHSRADEYDLVEPGTEDPGVIAAPPIRTIQSLKPGAKAPALCVNAEIPGSGKSGAPVDAAEWRSLMDSYHAAKRGILTWLKSQEKKLPPATYATMKEKIEEIRIQRPSEHIDGDLQWRGIGALTLDPQGQPVIQVGPGFLALMKQNPGRGKFELGRLIAQSWPLCDLVGAKPLSDLVACAGTPMSCGDQSYSDAGWAVSTAISANLVADPGCRVPGFASRKELDACVARAMGFATVAAPRAQKKRASAAKRVVRVSSRRAPTPRAPAAVAAKSVVKAPASVSPPQAPAAKKPERKESWR